MPIQQKGACTFGRKKVFFVLSSFLFSSLGLHPLSFSINLQVRLEHILDRISLISDAANTEKPSSITNSLFIGGALAARSVYTLQHVGITHIVCLCANEIGQSDSQYPDLFEYRNYSVSDLLSSYNYTRSI